MALVCLFGPKLFIIFFKPEQNVRRVGGGATGARHSLPNSGGARKHSMPQKGTNKKPAVVHITKNEAATGHLPKGGTSPLYPNTGVRDQDHSYFPFKNLKFTVYLVRIEFLNNFLPNSSFFGLKGAFFGRNLKIFWFNCPGQIVPYSERFIQCNFFLKMHICSISLDLFSISKCL